MRLLSHNFFYFSEVVVTSIINVENLTFSYPSGEGNIFENASFRIDTDWKLGFVGRNGRGKTTFLNLLQGKYEYRGKITSSVEFVYFPYPVRDKSKPTEEILREICPEAEEWEFMRELSYLDTGADILYRPFGTLSNGEQTKVLLSALFLSDGKFPLIDEPTNHLDARARETVSAYLKRKRGFILVSHDRNFLDGCVDHILSINRTDIEVQSGNFSSFSENFARRQSFESRQNERLQKDIRRLKEAAGQTAEWAERTEASKNGTRNSGLRPDRGYIGHKSAKMMKRAKTVEGRFQREIEQKSELLKNAEIEENLKLSPLSYRAERLVSLSSVAPRYGEREVCPPITFTISRGDRIALDGANGSGKSSILKIICGFGIEHGGVVNIGSELKISYVPQDTSHLCGTLSAFLSEGGINQSLFYAILHKTGFEKNQFDKDISAFSSGQKKKILIAKSLCESAHLYVWDEPLNYIDVYSRIQIENLIAEFKPTMIFVEHDKAFREKIATQTVYI